VGVIALMASFFFMSIMFPDDLCSEYSGLGEHTKLGSSLLVMSIVASHYDPADGVHCRPVEHADRLCHSLVCFAVIAAYGAIWQRLEQSDKGEEVAEEISAA